MGQILKTALFLQRAPGEVTTESLNAPRHGRQAASTTREPEGAQSFKIHPFVETLDEARDLAYAVLLKLAKVTGVLTFSKVSSGAIRDKRFL